MVRKSKHTKDELRELILSAAEVLVADSGSAELKVRNIAMEVGYTVGTLYMVFDSLEELQLQVNSRTLAKFFKVLFPDKLDFKLADFISNYKNFVLQNYNLWQMLVESGDKGPKYSDWYHAQLEELIQKLESELQKLTPINKETSELRCAAQSLFFAIQGICHAMTRPPVSTDRLAQTQNILKQYEVHFLHAWQASAEYGDIS